MCDRYLHCPYCSRRLVALCNIAGDNATGVYLEFFLVKPVGTEASAFQATRAAAVAANVVSVITPIGAVDADGVIDAPLDAPEPGARGFDDDEAPFPKSR